MRRETFLAVCAGCAVLVAFLAGAVGGYWAGERVTLARVQAKLQDGLRAAASAPFVPQDRGGRR